MNWLRRWFGIALLAAAFALGCRDARHGHHDHEAGGHGHHHEAPHGGTLVVLGDEDFHLEFLLEPEHARMQAFVLDGHAEHFIRLPARSFEVLARLPEGEETLVFQAVAKAETGETAGDTALFQAEAEWLGTHRAFEAVLQHLAIRGREYRQVPFHFPEGNE